MNSRLWIIVVVAGALGLGAGAAVRHWLPSTERPATDAAAELNPASSGQDEHPDVIDSRRLDFSLPDRDGETRSIGDFGGRVVLLNFWATWCPPCLEEIPALNRLHQDLGDQGLSVVGVALEGAEPVRAFAEKHEVGYPLLVGGREAFDIAAEYGNTRGTLPYSVVIDRSGTIRATHQGALTREEAYDFVAPWLQQSDAGSLGQSSTIFLKHAEKTHDLDSRQHIGQTCAPRWQRHMAAWPTYSYCMVPI